MWAGRGSAPRVLLLAMTSQANPFLVTIAVIIIGASLLAPMVKNPPAMRGTQVRSLGREDPLKESMATHSSILAWRIP